MATYWSQLFSPNVEYEKWSNPPDNEGMGLSTLKYRQARFTMTDAEAATASDGDIVQLMPVRLNERLVRAWLMIDGEWASSGGATVDIGFWRMGPNGTLGSEIAASTWSKFLVDARSLEAQTHFDSGGSWLATGQWAFASKEVSTWSGGVGGEAWMYGMRWFDMPGVAAGLAPATQNSEFMIVAKLTPDTAFTAGGTFVFQYWYVDV